MITVKYSDRIPAIYFRCKKAFGVSWDRGVIITYGDTVYSKHDIPANIKVHEEVHVNQQMAMGPAKWWSKYLDDKKFRLDQEVEAYKTQLDYIDSFYSKDEYELARKEIIHLMVTMYDKMCTEEEAIKLLDESPTTSATTKEEGSQDRL